MDNLDESETNAKVSDSAYSNSCSNRQSRRSHSSTRSGSNSSGSSGYGGKPSTPGSSNNLDQPPKKDRGSKKKKILQTETVPDIKADVEIRPSEPIPLPVVPEEEPNNVMQTASPPHTQTDKEVENMDTSTHERNSAKYEVVSCVVPLDGFSCVISMHDGVVMYITPSITTTLGFPNDMWIGRSFIDFMHPRDRNIFASQITKGLAVPKIVPGTHKKGESPGNSVSTVVCRIRKYRGLNAGFGVKESVVTFMPFLLKLTFKNISDEEGKVIYLLIQATPFFSAFRTPNEIVVKAVPFVLRHAANGVIEYIDPESVPYLGYLPQDLAEKNALEMYHPDDLTYLRQVYETIVREGEMARSKPYRMLAQNGDYIKLETEWSSFINPWSKKLEFVTGKHYVMEGPTNPNVFKVPKDEDSMQVSEEEKNKVLMLRENIVKIMNEALTKPAEVAKQQMSKRCQDLATFMESLIEEPLKTDDELHLDIYDPDHSYYERDSVMLGGISPHHELHDSKSSTETPLSYTQLNYNQNLQRYFKSHQARSYEEYNTGAGENVLGLKDLCSIMKYNNSLGTGPLSRLSPMAQTSGDSGELTSSCESSALVTSNSPKLPIGDYQPLRLTESLLTKHNAEMEKELIKIHREARSNSKGERENTPNESRQKIKEHLARCNTTFQPISVGSMPIDKQPHGVKRASEREPDEARAHKYHCPSPRQSCRRQRTLCTSSATAQPSSTMTTTITASHWPTNTVGNLNTFILGVEIPQQMPIISPVPAMTGVIPMYYTSAAMQPIPSTSENTTLIPNQLRPPHMPYMMYGQPMYNSSYMYSPMSTQVSYPTQQSLMPQSMQYPLGLANRNYEEACKPSLSMKHGKFGSWCDEKMSISQEQSSTTDQENADNIASTAANEELNRDSGSHNISFGIEKTNSSRVMEAPNGGSSKILKMSQSSLPKDVNKIDKLRGYSEETIDKTDESSYSSFTSSFFKTEFGSAEDSVGDSKKGQNSKDDKNTIDTNTYIRPQQALKIKRKMDPPWLEQVYMTSELIYKYQVLPKTMDEVLTSDKQKICKTEQPYLVNEQLSQLYQDLQLEGAQARLKLDESITSSSSSGEESSIKSGKGSRRKREYSKLAMIYEEDTPLPPPSEEES